MKSARISIGGLGNKYHTPLYILITITLFTIASITVLSIRFALTGAVGNEGNATLTNVSIKQAGTGQSVAIKGETLDEITLNQEAGYGTDDASRRIILNNNVVRYDATYNVTSPGIIELSITLPANNTIDEATIGSAQQCMNGSKLESADITNSDGTITKSYTNNKATCIRNITSPGSTNWNITAYPWGSNNEQITPTLAINNQAQATKPEPITVVGRPNYGIGFGYSGISQGVSPQYNGAVAIGIGLFIPKNEATFLGAEPLKDGNWEFDVDMSEWPEGWIVDATSGNNGLNYYSIPGNGVVSAEKTNDNGADILRISVTGAATGIRFCATNNSGGSDQLGDDSCVQSMGAVRLGIPINSLTDTLVRYDIGESDITPKIVGSSGGQFSDVSYYGLPLSWDLNNRGYGSMTNYGISPYPIGWLNGWRDDEVIYDGEEITTYALASQNYGVADYIQNIDACVAISDNSSLANFKIDPTYLGNGDSTFEWGVVSVEDGGFPNLSNGCGRVGDELSGVSFFINRNDAERYADDNNSKVNVLRIHLDELQNGRDRRFGYLTQIFSYRDNDNSNMLAFSIRSDQYDLHTSSRRYTLTPGLLSHTLTAEPSSTNPGKEDHITITTKTYNKDTNAKITVNLPTGLSIKPGTITIKDPATGNPIPLIEGETSDYTVSLNATNTTKLTNGSTITFNLDNIATNHGINLTGYEPIYPGESGVTNIECNTVSNTTNSSDTNLTCHEVITTNNNNTDDDPINDDLPIAADNNGNGIEHTHTPIEFDVVIDEDTPAPSTLTINSTASGTGTDYASSTFKSASDTIAVADPPRTFGYDLTTSSNYVYAGDNLTYNYQVSNLTNNEVTNLDLVTVLPYNEDSRGTTGLIDPTVPATNPYTLTNLTTSLPDGVHLYYTIDTTAVRQIEQGKDTSDLISDPSIIWQELDSNTIPTDIASKITALRLSVDNFAMDSKANFSITLTNILANNPTTDLQPSLASDITYLGYQAAGIPTLTSHTNLVKTSYEGNLLVLNPDKTTITTNLNPNEVKLGNGNVDNPDSLTNRLDITARTLNGYTVTMQVKGSDNSLLPISTNNTSDNTNRLIPAINTTPTAGLTGWAISLDTTNANPTWQAVPAIDSDTDQPTLPLAIYQTDGNGPKSLRLPIAYGVSTSQNTVADTYRAEVVYTLTAEL